MEIRIIFHGSVHLRVEEDPSLVLQLHLEDQCRRSEVEVEPKLVEVVVFPVGVLGVL